MALKRHEQKIQQEQCIAGSFLTNALAELFVYHCWGEMPRDNLSLEETFTVAFSILILMIQHRIKGRVCEQMGCLYRVSSDPSCPPCCPHAMQFLHVVI